jgi:NAD+ kinase
MRVMATLSKSYETPEAHVSHEEAPWRIGVVVHPARDISQPLSALREWAAVHGVEVFQVAVLGGHRHVAEPGQAGDCDLIVSIGGDGTTLAAIRAAAKVDRPVLGVACGSLGALTTIPANGVSHALDRFSRQEWVPCALPGLEVARDDGPGLFAINDIAAVRAGQGQLRTTARVDGILFNRLAGDGCVVSTPIGSSAYALAAGGPLLAPGADAYLFTPLPTHGGVCPPLVVGAASELQLDVAAGHGGARLEVDGQVADTRVGSLSVTFRSAVATLVGFADQEPLLSGLRRRQIITDSPRILADDKVVPTEVSPEPRTARNPISSVGELRPES